MQENRARVVLPPPPRVCLSGTNCQRIHRITTRLCDCIVVWDQDERSFVAAVELKAGDVDVSRVREQLQGAAAHVEHLEFEVPVRQFLPILVHARGLRTAEVNQLRTAKVRFRGVPLNIIPQRSGAELAQVAREFA